jgi:acetyltransferase-like isoleucine patch superfamily enzyme
MSIPIGKMITVGLLPSPLKRAYYRMKGARIGKRVKFGLLSVITAREIEIGDDARIGPMSFINVRRLRLGKRVRIHSMVAVDTNELTVGDDSAIMEQVVVGGMLTPRSKLVIGERVKVFPYSFLNPTEPITIDDDAGIGGANYIFTHGSWQSQLDGFPVSFGPVHIQRGVWFPWRVFVMPNVTVGEYATIGAGSIITKDVPPRSLAAGSPAKVLRTGPEYIKEFSADQKHEMVVAILREFAEFMAFRYERKVEAEVLDDGVVVRDGGRSVRYVREPGPVPKEAVVVVLSPLSQEQRAGLDAAGKVWFDISGKATRYSEAPVWQDVRDFFSRYGVRFKVMDN